jgi:DNA polymerase III delta prime subunit
MPDNLILTALHAYRAVLTTGPPDEPPGRGSRRRTLKAEYGLIGQAEHQLSVAETRQALRTQMEEYLAMAHAPHMLLVAAPPGVGKTTLGVQAAEKHAAAGHRVLYLGPRHDFFQDVLRIAKYPQWWYEWLPRQAGDELKPETCHFETQMAQWLARGYPAIKFCANPKICGWSYINDGCPYHAQKETQAPIVFGQHQHLTLGHPLMNRFDLIIGDENPLQAFMHHWTIPGKHIAPRGMDPTEPMTELVHELQRLAEREVKAEGPDLLQLLGGAEEVKAVCAGFVMPVDAVIEAPNLRNADAVDDAPYGHLPDLTSLLLREATAALTGRDYPHRVALANGKLHLLLRHMVTPEAQHAKLLWLDGTANVTLYESLFRRPVELVAPQVALCGQILQVWPRANGKRSLLKDGEPTSKAEQLQRQVAAIVAKGGYTNPAVITFEALKKPLRGQARALLCGAGNQPVRGL